MGDVGARGLRRDAARPALHALRSPGTEPDGLRGMDGDVGHDAQPAAYCPARRRAHSLRRLPAGTTARRSALFCARHPARILLEELVRLGVRCADAFPRPVWPSPRAGCLPTTSQVAHLALRGESRAVRADLHPCAVALTLLRKS